MSPTTQSMSLIPFRMSLTGLCMSLATLFISPTTHCESHHPLYDSHWTLYEFSQPNYESYNPVCESHHPLYESHRPLYQSHCSPRLSPSFVLAGLYLFVDSTSCPPDHSCHHDVFLLSLLLPRCLLLFSLIPSSLSSYLNLHSCFSCLYVIF